MGREALQKSAVANDGRRGLALESLAALIRKHPISLAPVLPTAVHTIVRCIDPADPVQRKELSSAVTRVLCELVNKYPSVSFHQDSQRFAVAACPLQAGGATHHPTSVSASSGAGAAGSGGSAARNDVVVFDLRTANKWKTLTGHKGSVTAVSFSGTGQFLVTYSHDESPPCLRLFDTTPSTLLSSIFGAQGRLVSTTPLKPITLQSGRAAHLLDVRFSWSSQGPHNEHVTLKREDGSAVSIKVTS